MQLERIYVDRERQAGGLGSRLLAASLELCGRRGAEWIWLAVWEENAAARRFYARHGFEIAGRTHFMLGPERQDDLIMARRLRQT